MPTNIAVNRATAAENRATIAENEEDPLSLAKLLLLKGKGRVPIIAFRFSIEVYL